MLKSKGLIILLTGLTFSFILNLPDIYPALKNVSAWVPVNSPPYALGDEYVYFSYLNAIYKSNFFSLPLDNFQYPNRHSIDFYPVFALLINLPAYLMGTFINDQRLGILFVRFFNSLLLFFSLFFLYRQIDIKVNKSITHYIFIVVAFLAAPVYLFSMENVLGSFKYYYGPYSIYTESYANNLVRAIYCSTSGPLLIGGVGYLIGIFNRPEKVTENMNIVKVLLIFTGLSMVHPPTGIIFLCIWIFVVCFYYWKNISSKTVIKIIVVIIYFSLAIFIELKLMSYTETSKEARVLFDIPFTISGIKPIIVVLLPILLYAILRNMISTTIFLVFFGLGIFCPAADLLGGDYGSRFWIRGALYPYTAIAVYLIWQFFKLIIEKINIIRCKHFSKLVLISAWGLMTFFFYTNTIYLYENKERITIKPDLLKYILSQQEMGNIIVTNSIDLVYFAPLYSNMRIYVKNYSLQPFGYKVNLRRTMQNYALMGVRKDDFVKIFAVNPRAGDWAESRPFNYTDAKYESFYRHSVVFSAVLKEYNSQLKVDGMYDIKGNINKKMLDYLEREYPKDDDGIYSNKKINIIIDRSASKILKTKEQNDFNYENKKILDNGEIVLLENVRLE